QQSMHQMMKKEIMMKQIKNIEEIAILRFKNKTEKVTSERICKKSNKRLFDQETEEA
ncbi:25243_t:CDS:2, partial [Cetraspora pellucida]